MTISGTDGNTAWAANWNYADRVKVGRIVLIVRQIDEHGLVSSVGISLEPGRPRNPASAVPEPARKSFRWRGILPANAGHETRSRMEFFSPRLAQLHMRCNLRAELPQDTNLTIGTCNDLIQDPR